jgi:hypothetical protein
MRYRFQIGGFSEDEEIIESVKQILRHGQL